MAKHLEPGTDIQCDGNYLSSTASDDTILYDLTVQTEWRLDPEPLTRTVREKVTSGNKSTAANLSSTWSFVRNIGLAVSPVIPGYSSPPFGLTKLINAGINWKFSISGNGELLAILEDNAIEIRSSQNEFTAVRSRWLLPGRDMHPQWRCLTWSLDTSILAASDSSGDVRLYDEAGTAICHIPASASTGSGAVDLSLAVCGLIFKNNRTRTAGESGASSDNEHGDSMELLVANYQASLTSYRIRIDGNHQALHTFSFSSYYPDGIGSIVYHPTHSLMLIGGLSESLTVQPIESAPAALKSTATAAQYGITAWRVLSGAPYYKLVNDYDTDVPNVGLAKRRQVMKRLKSHWYSWSRGESTPDCVYKLSLSPNGTLLASVHQSGRVSIWRLPSLLINQTWPLESQPGYDAENRQVSENPKKKKAMKDLMQAFHLSDIAWWSDEALIISRANGAVTVSSVKTLCNLLGASPEWFEPESLVTSASRRSFLALECENKFTTKRYAVNDESNGGREEREEDTMYDDSDDEQDATFTSRLSSYVRHGMYYVTDSERFQPPRKRPKLVSKTYRLVCLCSTTPQELYSRKIENEEYGEALALAHTFHLDCDLVYQRQWRKAAVSVASIQDYLSKISKRSWVLHECLERVPEDFDTMNELLQYGLRGTDVHALVAIGNRQDGGRFMANPLENDTDDDEDDDDEDDWRTTRKGARDSTARKRRQEQKKQKLLEQVDFSSLSIDQKELCRVRLKLLQFTDRLHTYQEILGGFRVAPERYNSKFFEKFRQQNIVEMAVEYAQAGDCIALDYIFTYHGCETLPHRLAILRNFPETYPPSEYRQLLPQSIKNADQEEMLSWPEEKWRDPMDWCERYMAKEFAEADRGEFLYQEHPDWKQFVGTSLSRDKLSVWYQERALEIERLSGQVDLALQLVNIAAELSIHGLGDLQNDLTVMEMLVYECRIDEALSFAHLREMTNLDRLRLIMSRSSAEMYIKNIRKWAVPFLSMCEAKAPGSFNALLCEYLISMAFDDLTFCSLIIAASKPTIADPIISDQSRLISIACDCIYSYSGNDQLETAFAILVCLPERGSQSDTNWTELHNRLDKLENHLRGAEILEKNGLPQTIATIRDTEENKEEAVKIFTRIMRTAGRREPVLGELKLKKMLQDLLELRNKVYNCVSKDLLNEIFVESLLCSGLLENIQIAGRMIPQRADIHNTSSQSRLNHGRGGGGTDVTDVGLGLHQWTIDYDKSVELVLSAAREYFDSSATLNDSDMELARACLGLISAPHPAIEEEKDLIEAVRYLEGFAVSILPVQVRMCANRLELIERSIAARQSTYKSFHRLLKLGQLLRIGAEGVEAGDSSQGGRSGRESKGNSGDGHVLCLVAHAALKHSDYKTAYEVCSKLILLGYGHGWKECLSLAEAPGFNDIQAKTELLSFAVIHCSPEMIGLILKAKCLLESQILHLQVHSVIEGDRRSQSPPVSPTEGVTSEIGRGEGGVNIVLNSTRSALGQTKEILQSTNKVTRALLSQISDRDWWKSTVSRLQKRKREFRGMGQADRSRTDPEVEEEENANIRFDRLGCHSFYESLYESCFVNTADVNYSVIGQPNCTEPSLHESLLRTAKLEEIVTGCDNCVSITQVLLLLAEDCIAQDSMLGIAYLLALPNVCDADTCFEKIPATTFSLQLATYYYALQICSYLRVNSHPSMENIYQWKMKDLSTKMLDYLQSNNNTDWSLDVQKMTQQFLYHNERMLDYIQACKLQTLNRGVDISRLLVDQVYKKETILGMVMCIEDEAYNTAVTLAKRYKINLREVYMTHLEYLFEDESITTDEIRKRVERLDLISELSRDYIARETTDNVLGDNGSLEFTDRMLANVYPLISGEDHDRLILFYTLLLPFQSATKDCLSQCGNDPSQLIDPQAHIKLLKKLKEATPGVDYKDLTDGKRQAIDVLMPFLSHENVNKIAKLAPSIRTENASSFQPSNVFRVWATKLFLDEQLQRGSKAATIVSRPRTMILDIFAKSKAMFQNSIENEWLHRYDDCEEFVQKMSTDDLHLFIQDIIFCETACMEIPVDCRRQIIRKTLKFAKQQQSAKKKRPDCIDNLSWDGLIREFQQSLDHLDKLCCKTVEDLRQSSDEKLKHYALLFDLTRSDSKRVEELLMKMIADGESIELVEDMRQAAVLTETSVKSIVIHVLHLCLISLRNPEETVSFLKTKMPAQVLSTIVDQVQSHQEKSGTFISCNDVTEILQIFCSDPTVEPSTRLAVLQVMEKTLKLTNDTDDTCVLRLRTQAIVSTIDANMMVGDRELKTDEDRQLLFDSLLNSSSDVPQFIALMQLLQFWPKLPSASLDMPATNPWCQIVEHMLINVTDETVVQILLLVSELHSRSELPTMCTMHIADCLLKTPANSAVAVKCILSSPWSELYNNAIDIIRINSESIDDEEIYDLILKRHLLPQTASTAIFNKVTDYVLENQATDKTHRTAEYLYIETVVKELQESGYQGEAGTLLMKHRSTHKSLRTYDAAFSVLTRLFKH